MGSASTPKWYHWFGNHSHVGEDSCPCVSMIVGGLARKLDAYTPSLRSRVAMGKRGTLCGCSILKGNLEGIEKHTPPHPHPHTCLFSLACSGPSSKFGLVASESQRQPIRRRHKPRPRRFQASERFERCIRLSDFRWISHRTTEARSSGLGDSVCAEQVKQTRLIKLTRRAGEPKNQDANKYL